MTVRIVTDSTCDLPAEIISKYGIRVVPLYINVGAKGYLDGIEMSREEFYTRLPHFPVHPTTAVPSPEKFLQQYNELESEGASEILSIHISQSLSGVENVAKVAALGTNSVHVTVLDSQQLSLGTGFLVETAAKLAQAGQSLSEILAVLDNQIKHTYVFAALDTLEFLKRSGRINGFMAKLGGMLQLKPLLSMYSGFAGTERVRTRDGALRRLQELLQSVGKIEKLAIVHTHAIERVQELKALAAEYVSIEQILVSDITPVIGAHIGPGAYGFALVTTNK